MQAATEESEASGLPFEEADIIMTDIKDELASSEVLAAEHEDIERRITERTKELARADAGAPGSVGGV